MAKRTPKAPRGPTAVDAIKHRDKRKNIPTEELRDFVADEEAKPQTMLYPRDPSLDPQLVWKGKDEQDRADLAVPVVPIYIQEKVHPQAIIEHLRDTAKAGEREPELTLFDDFNGLDGFDKKVDFYRWEQHWSNRMILGDSLLVMTSLAEKEGLKGKVQMIYLDPPYGIKFGSNWQVSTRKWLHAAGEFTDGDGKKRRAAVSLGPEHGTVGPRQVKEAAKEAVLGVGYDVLIVCGFAFDPHVSEEARRYGKPQVPTARMNPDLTMGDELLKKTGAGNLFMVFGEPDVRIEGQEKDGSLVAYLKGVDVYDPTTGQIRSSSTDDIACWFIDTNYDGESFFVRHAYFTGADEPYEKLKRALRADIDESAWATLYSTVSRPFAPPDTGRIAVK
jgi:hypothetical protein